MRFDIVREKLTNFVRQILLWVVGVFLVVFTTAAFLAPITIGEQVSAISPIVRLLFVLLLDVGMLGFLYLQVRQSSRPEASGLMVRTSGAITEVSIDSARERILKAVQGLPDIVTASASVRADHGRADIELNVAVAGDDINVPAKQKEIDRALKQVVNKQLGLQMAGRPRVHIKLHVPEAPVTQVIAEPEKPQSMPPPAAVEPEKPALRDVLGGLKPRPAEEVPVESKAEPKDEKPRGGLLGGLLGGRKDDDKEAIEEKVTKGEKPLPETPIADERKPLSTAAEESDRLPETKAAADEDDTGWDEFAEVLNKLQDVPADSQKPPEDVSSPENDDLNSDDKPPAKLDTDS